MQPPSVAAERAVSADHAVAGNDDRGGIGGTRPRHGARGGGRSKRARHLTVRSCRAKWYGAQRLQTPALEGSSRHIGGQIKLRLRPREVPDDCAHPLGMFFRAPSNFSLRIFLAKRGGQRFVLVTQIDGG